MEPNYPKQNNSNGLMLRDAQLAEYRSAQDAMLVEYYANPKEAPMTTRDYLKVLFRQKAVIFSTFFTVILAVFIGLKLMTPVYEAGAKMLILGEKQLESTYYRDIEGMKNEVVLTQTEIVKSTPVMVRVVGKLKLDSRPLDYEREFASDMKKVVIDTQREMMEKKEISEFEKKNLRFKAALESLQKNIKVRPIPNTNLFMIVVRDYSPIEAATIANTVARYYVIFDLEQQLAELQTKYGEKHLAVTQLRDNIARMERFLTDKTQSYADVMGPASVKILDQAGVPSEPVGISKMLVALVAVISGLFLGIVLAFCFEYIDPTFRSPEDVEKFLNLPLLGSIPKRSFGSKLLKKEPAIGNRYTQSFQNLADHMHILIRNKNIQSILITSAKHDEGTSTVVVNLSTYLSKNLGNKVLLIDANLRSPSIHKIYKIPDNQGLSDVLEGTATFESAVWEVTPTLSVLPGGKSKSNPLSLMDQEKIEEIVAKAKEKFEIILIDGANLKAFRDAEVLSASMDAVVLVVEAGSTRRQAVKASIAPLEQKKANLIGAILNKRAFAVPGMIYDRV